MSKSFLWGLKRWRMIAAGLLSVVALTTPALAETGKGLAKQYPTPEGFVSAGGLPISEFNESPSLHNLVSTGALPPVSERLPAEPAVIEPADTIGQYGGTLTGPATDPNAFSWDVIEMRIQKMLTIDNDYQTAIPNIAQSFSLSEDKKSVTLTLRAGMKWSDGVPFGVDDIEYFYNNILANKDVTPAPDPGWMAGGKLAKFVRIDDTSFRWEFSEANPSFVMRLATETGFSGVVPAHYLKQFDPKENPDAGELAKSLGFTDALQMLQFKLQPYTYTWYGDSDLEPNQPTLRTYVYTGVDSSGNKTFERNPYFFKIDAQGNQLPYIDTLRRLLVPDLQAQDLGAIGGKYSHFGWGSLGNYTTYKKNEANGGFVTRLLPYLRGNEITFSFNVNHPDVAKKEVFGNIHFREAMSVAIDRPAINDLVYFGKATPRQAGPVPTDPFYEDWMGTYYAQFDPDLANKLLDEIGMDKRDGDGFRLDPNGQPFSIEMIEAPPEPAWQKTMELVAQQWNAVGVRTQLKIVDYGLFDERRRAGTLDVPAWGYDIEQINLWSGGGEVISQYIPPYNFGAVDWAAWIDTNGANGTEPPADVLESVKAYQAFRQALPTDPTYVSAGKTIFTTQIKNLYAIGTVGMPPQPLVISNRLRNGPKDGDLWSWTYRQWVQFLPEQFWLEN